MQENEIIPTQDIYLEHLTEISGIEFTYREIDIITCLLQARQQTEIAKFLEISRQTINNHVNTINGKLTNQKKITDFIRQSNKFTILEKIYYPNLSLRIKFEEQLKKLKLTIQQKNSFYCETHWGTQRVLVEQIKDHLKIIGIEPRKRDPEDNADKPIDVLIPILKLNEVDYVLYIMPPDLIEQAKKGINKDYVNKLIFTLKTKQGAGAIVFTQLNQRIKPQEKQSDVERELFLEGENYYYSFFEILKKLFPENNFEQNFLNLKEEWRLIEDFGVLKSLQTPNAQRFIQDSDIFIPFKSLDEQKLKQAIKSWGPPQEKCISGGPSNWSNMFFLETVPEDSTESYLIQVGNLLHQSAEATSFVKTNPKVLVLTGLGGIGKTSLASAYTKLSEINKLYELIYWIQADKRFDIIQGYKRILSLLGEKEERQDDQEIVDHLRIVLKDKKYLLVFNNVSTPNELKDLLPQGQKGHSLITSRFSESGWELALPLDPFSPEEAIHYLFTRTCHPDNESTRRHTTILAEELAYLPLALAQAASFIEVRKCSFEQYIKEYEERSASTLDYKDKKGDYPNTIATTWFITMDEISKLAPLSRKLMAYFAYLSPDDIPISFFRDSVLGDNSEIEECIDTLSLYSMIKRSEDLISLHRLVQKEERIGQESTLQGQKIVMELIELLIEKSKYLFSKSFKDREVFTQALIYLNHILTLLEHIKRLNINNTKVQSFKLLSRILYHRLSSLHNSMKLIDRGEKNGSTQPELKGTKNKIIDILSKKARSLFVTQKRINEEVLYDLLGDPQYIHPEIKKMVGGFFYFGIEVEQNDTKAFEWMEAAAFQGDDQAQFAIGVMYSNGQGVEQDDVKAFEWTETAAFQGNVNAQFNLGIMYANGEGVGQSNAKAFVWLEKAALQSHTDAQIELGFMYAQGKEIEKNNANAFEWFEKAALQGRLETKFHHERMYAHYEEVKQESSESIEWLEKIALQGDVQTQFFLGSAYSHGEGVEQDDTKAFKWFEKAALQGHAPAQFAIGAIYFNGQGVEKNDTKAFEWVKKAALQGDPQAQFLIGVMYSNGQGIEKNDAKAFEWFEKAALQGEVQAQFAIGMLYTYGQGIEKNDAKAFEWMEKAASQGHVQAQLTLGLMYANGQGVKQNEVKAFEWFRKTRPQSQSNPRVMYDEDDEEKVLNNPKTFEWTEKVASQGDAQAQFYLGLMYENGQEVEKNDTKALEWYNRAAFQGDAQAQFAIGVMYSNGQGIEKNDAKAFYWYEKSALQGNAKAQFHLGLMYAQDHEIKQDDTKAFYWYEKSALQGNVNTQFIYTQKREIEKNNAKAFEWVEKAALQGYVQAQLVLGAMYANGQGVEQNDTKAFEWYEKAALQDDANAQFVLGFLYERGGGVEQNDTKAFEWYEKAALQGHADAQYYLEHLNRE